MDTFSLKVGIQETVSQLRLYLRDGTIRCLDSSTKSTAVSKKKFKAAEKNNCYKKKNRDSFQQITQSYFDENLYFSTIICQVKKQIHVHVQFDYCIKDSLKRDSMFFIFKPKEKQTSGLIDNENNRIYLAYAAILEHGSAEAKKYVNEKFGILSYYFL